MLGLKDATAKLIMLVHGVQCIKVTGVNIN